MAPPVQVSSIPAISDLYTLGELSPSSLPDPSLQPSASLNSKISFFKGSITTLATTCIVNAANESLLGGGGVDGAIHSAAGPSLLRECRQLHGCRTGSAKITKAHELPSSYIIHAVGPIYIRAKSERPGSEADLLRGCYKTSMDLAGQKGGSIAFSCLSAGVYGYPSRDAAEIACREVRRWLEDQEADEDCESKVERVVFCLFEAKDVRAYKDWLPKIFPPEQQELPTPPPAPASTPAAAAASTSKPAVQQQEEVEGSGVLVQETEAADPAAPPNKKARTGDSPSQETSKDDWEPVEKPNVAEASSLEKSTEMSEEGEKVEGEELAADDGEKIEKPGDEPMAKTTAGYEMVEDSRELDNKLGRDW